MHVADGVFRPRWSWDGAYLFYESPTLGVIYRVLILRDPLDESAVGPPFGEPEEMFVEPRAIHTHWDVPRRTTQFCFRGLVKNCQVDRSGRSC